MSLVSKPAYPILFILFSLLGTPVAIMKHFGILEGGEIIIQMLIVFVVITFLTAGLYSIAWKSMNDEKASLFVESKKHFQHVLGVSIVVGIITAIVSFPFPFAHKMFFLPDIAPELYAKRLDSNLIRTIPSAFVSLVFVYAIPAIFACGLNGKEAVTNSWKFLSANLAISKIIIICLTLSTLFEILIIQWAVSYDYSSNKYWLASTISSVIHHLVSFIIFLCAAQILKENYKKEESHITN
jgi:hypothetical protein